MSPCAPVRSGSGRPFPTRAWPRGGLVVTERRVVLYLLESAHGPPLQYWSFDNEQLIRVGRSIENQVVVANPYVSRAHCYLLLTEQGWSLNAISDQGIFVRSEKLEQLPLVPGLVFRMGRNGPFLRFGNLIDTGMEKETLEADDPLSEMLQLDKSRVQREVAEITQGDFFQRLKTRVESLRGTQNPDPDKTMLPTR